MDKKLFLNLYRLSNERSLIGKAAMYFTKSSSVVFFIVYSVTGCYLLIKRDARIIWFLALPFFTLVLCFGLRRLIKRPRPFVSLGITPLIKEKASFSMPSNHAASSLIISLVCVYLGWPIVTTASIFLLIFALLTGISRIFAGVHYPSDILVGWTLSLCTFSVFLIVFI